MASPHTDSDSGDDDEIELLKSDVVPTPNKTNFKIRPLSPVSKSAKQKLPAKQKPVPAPKPPVTATQAIVPQKRMRHASIAQQVFPKTKRWIQYDVERNLKKTKGEKEARDRKEASISSTIEHAMNSHGVQTQGDLAPTSSSVGMATPLQALRDPAHTLPPIDGPASIPRTGVNGDSQAPKPAIHVTDPPPDRPVESFADRSGTPTAGGATPDSIGSRLSRASSRNVRESSSTGDSKSPLSYVESKQKWPDQDLVANGWQVHLHSDKRLFVIPTHPRVPVMEVLRPLERATVSGESRAHLSSLGTDYPGDVDVFERQQTAWKKRPNNMRAYEVDESNNGVRWIPVGPDVIDETAHVFTLERALDIDGPTDQMEIDSQPMLPQEPPASSAKAAVTKAPVPDVDTKRRNKTDTQDSGEEIDTIMAEPLDLPEESDSSYHDESDNDDGGSDAENKIKSAMKKLQASFGLSTSPMKKSTPVDVVRPRAEAPPVTQQPHLLNQPPQEREPSEQQVEAAVAAPVQRESVVKIAVDLSHDGTGLAQYDEDLLMAKLRRGRSSATRSTFDISQKLREFERRRAASPEFGAIGGLLRRTRGGAKRV